MGSGVSQRCKEVDDYVSRRLSAGADALAATFDDQYPEPPAEARPPGQKVVVSMVSGISVDFEGPILISEIKEQLRVELKEELEKPPSSEVQIFFAQRLAQPELQIFTTDRVMRDTEKVGFGGENAPPKLFTVVMAPIRGVKGVLSRLQGEFAECQPDELLALTALSNLADKARKAIEHFDEMEWQEEDSETVLKARVTHLESLVKEMQHLRRVRLRRLFRGGKPEIELLHLTVEMFYEDVKDTLDKEVQGLEALPADDATTADAIVMGTIVSMGAEEDQSAAVPDKSDMAVESVGISELAASAKPHMPKVADLDKGCEIAEVAS